MAPAQIPELLTQKPSTENGINRATTLFLAWMIAPRASSQAVAALDTDLAMLTKKTLLTMSKSHPEVRPSSRNPAALRPQCRACMLPATIAPQSGFFLRLEHKPWCCGLIVGIVIKLCFCSDYRKASRACGSASSLGIVNNITIYTKSACRGPAAQLENHILMWTKRRARAWKLGGSKEGKAGEDEGDGKGASPRREATSGPLGGIIDEISDLAGEHDELHDKVKQLITAHQGHEERLKDTLNRLRALNATVIL